MPKGTERKGRLDRVARRLRLRGLDEAADRVEGLAERFRSAVKATSWFARKRERFAVVMRRHIRNAEQEVKETAHLVDVARRLLVEREPVSEVDRTLAREQFLDLLKTVPASAVLAGTFLIPVPGAQPVLAPILMDRLGLLPSAWSETEAEKDLRDLIRVAESHGLKDVAGDLDEVLQDLREDKAKVDRLAEYVKRNPEWNVFFDEDFDQKISRDELIAMLRRVQVTALEADAAGEVKEWYVYYSDPGAFDAQRTTELFMQYGDDTVKGPYSFSTITGRYAQWPNVLVRRGEEGWWVPLWALLEEMYGITIATP